MLRLATWVCLLLNVASARPQGAEPYSNLEFHSSNPALNETFKWAKQQALAYHSSKVSAIGPWYEAALPGRNAFCGRDVSHQTGGAAALGLFAANHNMLSRFAESAAASRNWATYWEIDGDGKPSTFDYVSDDDFWFNLPANFDLLDATVRMWRWTGDNTYRDDPRFQQFFRTTLSSYIDQWQLAPASILTRQRIVNRRLTKGKFVNSRGIPSYSEGTTDFMVGTDLLAAEYRAIRSYSEIAVTPQDRAFSRRMQRTADQLQHILESVAWDAKEQHFHGRIQKGATGGAGSGDTLALYFSAAKDPGRIRGALNYVSKEEYWGGINIEEETYIPIVLFRYGRSEAAFKVLFDMTRADKPRREYPEVSYAAIAAIVSGAMGIEPSMAGDNFDVETLAQPVANTDEMTITSLEIKNHTLDIRHSGSTSSSILNHRGTSLRWKAEFSRPCRNVRVNGRAVGDVRDSSSWGIPICFAIIAVPAGEAATVTIE